MGLEYVLFTRDAGFDPRSEQMAAALKTNAVFVGVGGDLIVRIAPRPGDLLKNWWPGASVQDLFVLSGASGFASPQGERDSDS